MNQNLFLQFVDNFDDDLLCAPSVVKKRNVPYSHSSVNQLRRAKRSKEANFYDSMYSSLFCSFSTCVSATIFVIVFITYV